MGRRRSFLASVLLFSCRVAEAATFTQLTTDGGPNFNPAWSPDGLAIAYQCNPDGGTYDIWLVPASGGQPAQLTFDPSHDTEPAWSPDGQSICFQSGRSGNTDLWVIPATGGEAHQITFHSATDASPSWSPDGTSIAFSSNRSPNGWYDIYRVAVKTGVVSQVTSFFSALNLRPSWSPDGSRIAFHSNQQDSGNHNNIWTVDADGGTPARLTSGGDLHDEPSWGATGYVAYSAIPSGAWDIWLVDYLSGDQLQITSDPAADSMPSWAPDGMRFAFRSDRSGSDELWIASDLPVGPIQIRPRSWSGIKARYQSSSKRSPE
jgi:TolB protein